MRIEGTLEHRKTCECRVPYNESEVLPVLLAQSISHVGMMVLDDLGD